MIKLFRNIRKNLLAEGKTSKYLKYAIGEIILVVIGILIALQINNWNEIQKENQFEKKVLNEILIDTEADLLETKDAINMVNVSQESGKFILEQLTTNSPYRESLDVHFAHSLRLWSLSPNATAFEMAKTEGMHLIKNDTIRTMIAKVNGYQYDYAGVLESRWQDYNSTIVIPNCVSRFDFYNFDSMHPNYYDILKSDMAYQGIMKTLIAMRIRYLDNLQTRYETLFVLNKKIKEELQ